MQKGFSVKGLERSSEMVALAREKSIEGFTPIVADIENYDLSENFDVAVSLFHVISYLTLNESLVACFKSTSQHLNNGGIFIFDVWYSPAVYYQVPETRIKRMEDEVIAVTRLAEPEIHYNENVVDVNYEIMIRDKNSQLTEVYSEKHPMRHFSIPEIKFLASLTGFKVICVEEFLTGVKPGKNTWGVCFILQKNKMNNPIPVNTPLLSGNELKYLTECIETGWISSEGPFIKDFETKFSKYVERKFGVAVSNGSAALDIAIQALQLGKGDEVIMPTFTIISPAQSVVRAGAIPVLVDSHSETWNMDVSQIEAKITPKTKAILVVHIYGLPVDMDPVLALCKNINCI